MTTSVISAPAGTTVECVYRVSRPREAENLVATGLANFKMLWHGTNILNLMSILHKGLMLTEPPPTGPLLQFGKVPGRGWGVARVLRGVVREVAVEVAISK